MFDGEIGDNIFSISYYSPFDLSLFILLARYIGHTPSECSSLMCLFFMAFDG